MKTVIFINSHPIQYFAPMYKYMNEKGLQTGAWYCSDDSIKGGFDKEFGVNVKWDIPLLQGYDFRLFKNYSWKPSIFKGFFGLMNFGLIRQMFREQKSVFVVHGWNYCTHFLVLMLGKIKGHTICLRNDMPLSHEAYKKGWKQKIKKFGLTYIVFPRIDFFMYIGNQNRLFYKSYGILDVRLISCPYAVDNQRFRDQFKNLVPEIPHIKKDLSIPASHKVIIFSGKYIEKKRPLDLLRAFRDLDQDDCWLIMLGEGALRAEMEAFILEHQLKQVILTGFVNQSKIVEYYVIGDVFVMCSSLGENWGLSVNEAMNFNLPLILSDLTGCSDDLVIDGNNGYVFETGNVKALTEKLQLTLIKGKLVNKPSSSDLVKNFSYQEVFESIQSIAE